MIMTNAHRTVLRGGRVVDEGGADEADLSIVAGAIEQVGRIEAQPGDLDIDASRRLIMPGLIDAHTHADGRVFDDEVALALLRQGVTTVIAGQDGVSYAPGDGRYATRYFAAINGPHPTYRGGGVAELLAGYDGTTPINVGYLLPAGTIRHEVMGFRSGRPTAEELTAMRDLVEQGLAAGALGLSTGLDYTPGLFADAAELAELCRPVAAADALYVSHMRGYEEESGLGLEEVIAICEPSGVRGHISHFHARPELIASLLDKASSQIDLTFDWYPYSRGCSVLGMVLLPPELLALGFEATAEALGTPTGRGRSRWTWGCGCWPPPTSRSAP
jgi:N-acyl-D-amino-acid deacylase